MKKNIAIIIFIIFSTVVSVTSCADSNSGNPAAALYARSPEDVRGGEDITVEESLTDDAPETTTAETTTEPPEIVFDDEVAAPVMSLPVISESPLFSSVGEIDVILNINSGVYHLDEECTYVRQMLEENKRIFSVDDLSVLSDYHACSRCGTYNDNTVETTIIETDIEVPTSGEVTLAQSDVITVIVNTNTKTFHVDFECRHIKTMIDGNKGECTGTIAEIKAAGYKACGTCSKEYQG